jgi:uncharacterized membrane protein YphA (DoxX/SURF4 family)
MLRLLNWFTRLALSAAFLSAVADRFGLWGPFGSGPNVSWGDMHHFMIYAAKVNSFLPAKLVPTAGWAATIMELVFGIGLLTGKCTRCFALGSGLLLTMFGVAMAVSFGVKQPLNYSVFSAAAAAFWLAAPRSSRGRN